MSKVKYRCQTCNVESQILMSNVQCRTSNIDVKRAMSNVKYRGQMCNVESQILMSNVQCQTSNIYVIRAMSKVKCPTSNVIFTNISTFEPDHIHIVSLREILYPHCLMLVGSRNGFKCDFTIELNMKIDMYLK